MGILVSHSYINTNFDIRPAVTPSSQTDNSLIADIYWITNNYYVSVGGNQTTSRCPSSDELTSITPTPSVSITNTNSGEDFLWFDVSLTAVTITEKGICWNTSTNPTTSNSKINSGSVNSNFSVTIYPLSAATYYYVRGYIISNSVTYYSNQVYVPTTCPTTIGSSFQGGLLAYVLTTGDVGYIDGTCSGIVVTTSDGSAPWAPNTNSSSITTNTTLGSGDYNTLNITNYYGVNNYAAQDCSIYTNGGYSDWFLPSIDDLKKIYSNKNSLPPFTNSIYWSSSKYTTTSIYTKNMNTGNEYYTTQSQTWYYVAVRYFSVYYHAPTVTTTTTTVTYYGYYANEYEYGTCTLSQNNVLIQDVKSDLLSYGNYYFYDVYTGFVYEILSSTGTGGYTTNISGNAYVDCESVLAV